MNKQVFGALSKYSKYCSINTEKKLTEISLKSPQYATFIPRKSNSFYNDQQIHMPFGS